MRRIAQREQRTADHASLDRLARVGPVQVHHELAFLAVIVGRDVDLAIHLQPGQADANASLGNADNAKFDTFVGGVCMLKSEVGVSGLRLGRNDQRLFDRHLRDNGLAMTDVGPQIQVQRHARYPGQRFALPIRRVPHHHAFCRKAQEPAGRDMQT